MRAGPVDVCVAVVAVMPPATMLAWALPETVLFAMGCEGGADAVERTGSALPTLGWTMPLQPATAHLRAGSSFGTGGGVMVTNGGFEVVGGFKVDGIVGGGCTSAWDDRGITAKFG